MKRSEIIEGREYAVADVNEGNELGTGLLSRAEYLDDQGQKRVFESYRDLRGHTKGGYLRFRLLDKKTGEPRSHWQTGEEIIVVVRPQAVKGTWEENQRIAKLRADRERGAAEHRRDQSERAQSLIEDLHDMGIGEGYFDASVRKSRHGSVEGVLLSLSALEALIEAAKAGDAMEA